MVRAAILHEGSRNDKTADKKLIISLFKELGLPENSVDFYAFGYKSEFFNINNANYKELKSSVEAEEINKILFVVDADDEKDDAKYKGFENTENQLKQIVEKLGFQDISRVYIVCDPNTKIGYLESLILASLPEQKRKCIECFVKCSKMNSKNIHKRIINHLYTIAYPDPPYNFGHPHFDDLKAELKNLFA
ncbi:DUF3226 domain-containing protein [Candidatus Methylobacter oryzae]|uniref:DUF4276 family protein n=1 Tax=Candidatus Methylobacter oryzae TaxID=2497749 RepID=A0ABY3C648_9GAMM|nr:DUF3226 domain-containing protein [Candidatus Methylobacter oryzae]TRW90731.1 hypothetical protein EKO24_018210 [Candidatus Methylobacter oryzae]